MHLVMFDIDGTLVDSAGFLLCLTPRDPHGEEHRNDHEHDACERSAGCVVPFPEGDSAEGNGHAEDDEAARHDPILDRGLHEAPNERELVTADRR